MKLLLLLVALALLGCEQEDTAAHYQAGREDGCAEGGGTWNPFNDTCDLGQAWLMAQNADAVTFAFDDTVADACPDDSPWSGTMSMTRIDNETLWFSSRPSRHAFTQRTEVFADGFGVFPLSELETPFYIAFDAVLTWQDADTGDDHHAVMEIRRGQWFFSTDISSDRGTLYYDVCGLNLDDPRTRQRAGGVLPEEPQARPSETPTAEGRVHLLIDSGPDCAWWVLLINDQLSFQCDHQQWLDPATREE